MIRIGCCSYVHLCRSVNVIIFHLCFHYNRHCRVSHLFLILFFQIFFSFKRIHAVLQGVFFSLLLCSISFWSLYSMLCKRARTTYIVYYAQNNCLICSLFETWMICVIICVFNALQLCSLHIFGVLLPDHCRLERTN